MTRRSLALRSLAAFLAVAAVLLALGSCWPQRATARTPEYRVLLPRVMSSEAPWERGAAMDDWHPESCADLNALHVSWLYDWGTGGGNYCPLYEYVPMAWGRTYTTPTLTGNSAWLLGMNEPNNCNIGGSCVTPAEAATDWHYLEATGRLLVSPAPLNLGGDTWLDDFLALCAGCRVDAIGVHFYAWYNCTTTAVTNLEAYLLTIEARYPGMPLWLTEYGCREDNAGFLALVLPFVEVHTYRNAVWTMYPYTGWLTLFDAHGDLTELGLLYRGVMP